MLILQWYIDGESIYGAFATAMERAKHSIFISMWWLTPNTLLRRGENPLGLDTLLKRKAKEGVQVYVLLWKEITIAIDQYTKQTKAYLTVGQLCLIRRAFTRTSTYCATET